MFSLFTGQMMATRQLVHEVMRAHNTIFLLFDKMLRKVKEQTTDKNDDLVGEHPPPAPIAHCRQTFASSLFAIPVEDG